MLLHQFRVVTIKNTFALYLVSLIPVCLLILLLFRLASIRPRTLAPLSDQDRCTDEPRISDTRRSRGTCCVYLGTPIKLCEIDRFASDMQLRAISILARRGRVLLPSRNKLTPFRQPETYHGVSCSTCVEK